MATKIFTIWDHVHPQLYGDSNAHLTTFWTADNFGNTGCYNAGLQCSGFVQVSAQLYPGLAFPAASTYHGEQHTADLSIIQDKFSGNWWLMTIGTVAIGYWPKELFTHLSNEATIVKFGGLTFSYPDPVYPPMGNGYFPTRDLTGACYFLRMTTVDSGYNEVNLDQNQMDTFVSNSSCYNLEYFGDFGRDVGHTISFGGPGGECGI
uniref:Neprosin PEP catalytic domain-containing protein n=1 Tax=Fagus sylvatica TaxID=28930 RepID=A0A2N9ED84_FAGSY